MQSWFDNTYRFLSKIISRFDQFLALLAQVGLFCMLLILCTDIIRRYFFDSPVPSATEIAEELMVLVVYLPLALVHKEDAMIRVDLISSRLPEKPRLVLKSLRDILFIAVIVLVVWRTGFYALEGWERKTFAQGPISIPTYPAKFAVVIGYSALGISLVIDLLRPMFKLLSRTNRG